MTNNALSNPFAQNQQPQGNDIFSMMARARQSSNPDQAAFNMLSPELQTYISQNGGDAKTAFFNMAAEKGADPNKIINILKTFR